MGWAGWWGRWGWMWAMALALRACERGWGTAPAPPQPAPIQGWDERSLPLAARDTGSRWPRGVPLLGGHLLNLSSFLEDHGARRLDTMNTERRSASGGEARTERWLLDDAGCSVCAALAREAEALRGGRLQVQSLRDPEVQAPLDRVRPAGSRCFWRSEEERARIFAGRTMRTRLV
jgi:hypothetical protein